MDLLKMLKRAEEEVTEGCTAPIKETFDRLKEDLKKGSFDPVSRPF